MYLEDTKRWRYSERELSGSVCSCCCCCCGVLIKAKLLCLNKQQQKCAQYKGLQSGAAAAVRRGAWGGTQKSSEHLWIYVDCTHTHTKIQQKAHLVHRCQIAQPAPGASYHLSPLSLSSPSPSVCSSGLAWSATCASNCKIYWFEQIGSVHERERRLLQQQKQQQEQQQQQQLAS